MRVGGAPAPPTRRGRMVATAALLSGVLACAHSGAAGAAILAPKVLDGPSAAILDVDGAAMAPDGSGGIVYRKIADGVPHVYVDQFVDGSWRAPVQADVGQSGPATMPAIAACDGGELLVVWVQPWEGIASSSGATPTMHYRLMSALLQPGASQFGEVEPVDDVGDGTAAYPSLTMSPDCSAYVTYRVVTNPLTPGVGQPAGTPAPTDPGDELIDVRVARFDGAWWSPLGPVNAYEGVVTDRAPTAANAPQIATVANGEAVVVWQEPDLTGYARIWGRYIFGSSFGNPVQLSPSTVNGQSVDVDADAPSVGFLGEGAFRLGGGGGSPYGSSQMFGVAVPSAAASGSAADDAIDLGGGSDLGVPDAGADILGDDPVAATIGGQAQLVTSAGGKVTSRDLGDAAAGGPMFTVPDPDGGYAAAWTGTGAGGLPAVDVSERIPSGSVQTGTLAAPLGGAVTGLSVGDSTLGDAVLGWLQGPTDQQEVMGAVVQAPPETFQYVDGSNALTQTVQGPRGWVRPAQAKLSWAPAVDPLGRTAYEISVDGQIRARDVRGPKALAPALTLAPNGTAWNVAEARSVSAKLPRSGLGTGVHTVRIYATDQFGQRAEIGSVRVWIDASAPDVHIVFIDRRHGVRVRVTDDGPGVAPADTRIAFGDGTPTVMHRDTVTHVYAHSGRYGITVVARDRVGNRRAARIAVSVR
jgi:hypothetical protein